MGITSGGLPYDPAFPVAGTDNSSQGFRDNFATVQTVVGNLHTALPSASSVVAVRPMVNATTGLVTYDAQWPAKGLVMPSTRPTNPTAGAICIEGGQMLFYNGAGWVNFIPQSGNTLTIANIVVNTKLTLNYTPTANNDAASVGWVLNQLSGLSSGGGSIDPTIVPRIEALELGLTDEANARIDEDVALDLRIDGLDLRLTDIEDTFSTLTDDMTNLSNDLNYRMDVIEGYVGAVTDDFGLLSNTVSQSLATVNSDLSTLSLTVGDLTTDVNNRFDALAIVDVDGLLQALSDTANTASDDNDNLAITLNSRIDGLEMTTNNLSNTVASYSASIGNAVVNASSAFDMANALSGDVANATATADFAAMEATDAMMLAANTVTSVLEIQNNYLDRRVGGEVEGHTQFNDGLTVANSTLTLQNADLQLPESNVTLDAGQMLHFKRLPNLTGGGDGAYITYDDNNHRYAILTAAQEQEYQDRLNDPLTEDIRNHYEFATLRLVVENDSANQSNVTDSIAIEPSGHLFLNMGWQGAMDSGLKEQEWANSALYVGDAYHWVSRTMRDTGDTFIAGHVETDKGLRVTANAVSLADTTPITGALATLETLNGYLFDSEVVGAAGGFITSEVETNFSDAIVPSALEGLSAVDYQAIIALLVEAVKELKQQVDAL